MEQAKEKDHNTFPLHPASIIACQVGDIEHIYMLYWRQKELGPLPDLMKMEVANDFAVAIALLREIKLEARAAHSYMGKDKFAKLFGQFDWILEEYLKAYRDNGFWTF